MNIRKQYGGTFYSNQYKGSLTSAEVILGRLFSVYQPRSVVDFGCGVGAWLSIAKQLGATQLVGLDGNWVTAQQLLDSAIRFTQIDMESELPSLGRFDLAMSVEVAEHLSPRRAEPFVSSICKSSDVVVFGAAIKYQGGTHHVNEQPQSYWHGLFSSQGFEVFDLFRPYVWHNDKVEWWYRQNTFLYVKANSTQIDKELVLKLERQVRLIDAVHPELLRAYSERLKQDFASSVRQALARATQSLSR